MRSSRIAVVLAIVPAVLTLVWATQSQPGRPGSLGSGPSSLSSTWAALAFEVKVSNATLEKLRPHFELAWQEQSQALRKAAGDYQGFAGELQKIRARLDEALKTTLSAEEARKLAAWQKSRSANRPASGGVLPGRDRANEYLDHQTVTKL